MGQVAKATKSLKKATKATQVPLARLQKLLKICRKLLKLLKSHGQIAKATSASGPKVPSPCLVALEAFFEVLVAFFGWVSSFSGFYRPELTQNLMGSSWNQAAKATQSSEKATKATKVHLIRLQKLLKV